MIVVWVLVGLIVGYFIGMIITGLLLHALSNETEFRYLPEEWYVAHTVIWPATLFKFFHFFISYLYRLFILVCINNDKKE